MPLINAYPQWRVMVVDAGSAVIEVQYVITYEGGPTDIDLLADAIRDAIHTYLTGESTVVETKQVITETSF